MISEWIRAALDVLLIAMVGGGLIQAMRLIRHLRDLRQGRIEMERFVYEFNATVIRAEAGIKGLRHAARESGDDLEKLVEKAVMIRDELQFIVESADKLAERISAAASNVVRSDMPMSEPKQTGTKAPTPAPAVEISKAPEKTSMPRSENAPASETLKAAPTSRAEKELLQALQKLT